MGFHQVAVVLKEDTTHRNTHITPNNTAQIKQAHRATQTIKGTLHIEYNTKKGKTIPVAGLL
jgi:divalent metal cation (Fe/Co/Zn/Cd) transporter